MSQTPPSTGNPDEPRQPERPSNTQASSEAPAPGNEQHTAADSPEPARLGTFHAFSIPNYRLLWVGNAFTSVAMWIQQTTMGWVVYDLTSSGSILGSVNGVRLIPSLLLNPVAGIVADRYSRNRIIAVSQLCLFFFTFTIAMVLWTGRLEIWHLYAFSIMAGGAMAFNMPARQTMVFDIVPRSVVPNAVALSNMAFSMSRTAGPMIGGVLIVTVGAATNFLVQSLAYLLVMTCVLMLRLPARSQAPRRERSFLRDMSEGYRFASGDPQARLLFLMSVINPLFLIPLHVALLPIYAKNIFGGDASSLGIMLSAIGFGGFFGGLLTASLNQVDRRGLLQLGALFTYSFSQGAFSVVGAITGQLWFAVPFLATAGASEAVFNTTNQTVLQLVAPDHLRGRVVSVLQLGPMLMPIGIMFAGVMADIVGAPAVGTGLSTIAFCIGLGLLLFSPRLRRLRLSQLGEQQRAASRLGDRG